MFATLVVSGFCLLGLFFIGFGREFAVRRLKECADVIVLAPHQDDCVLLAGELALWTIQKGRNVRVIYITCGDVAPSTEQARVRLAEGGDVWRRAGIKPTDITCLDLPQSSLEGPSAWSGEDQKRLAKALEFEMTRAPVGARVICPAEHELHVDHRETQRAAMRAILASSRSDLVLLEGAEYNQFYDVFTNPLKALRAIVGSTPLMGWLVHRMPASPGGHTSLEHCVRLSPSRERRCGKLKLLQGFASEYNQLLEDVGRQPEIFRQSDWSRVAVMVDAVRECPRGYLMLPGRMVHWNVLLAFGLWCVLMASAAGCIGSMIPIPAYKWRVVFVIVICAVLMLKVRRNVGSPERFMVMLSIASGLCCGLLIGIK